MLKNKLSATLNTKAQHFNELSKQIQAAINTSTKQHSPSRTSTDSKLIVPNSATIVINPTDTNDQDWNMLQVHQGIETTHIMFDELDCLVRQQQQHFNTLEGSAAGTNHFTKEAAEQLHIAYAAQRQRARRTWLCAAILATIITILLWSRSPPAPAVQIIPRQVVDQPDVIAGIKVDVDAAQLALDALKQKQKH